GFKGACGNAYVREERLSGLLVDVVKPIQITAENADGIATAIRASDTDVEQRRLDALSQLERRRQVVTSKLDRRRSRRRRAFDVRRSRKRGERQAATPGRENSRARVLIGGPRSLPPSALPVFRYWRWAWQPPSEGAAVFPANPTTHNRQPQTEYHSL